MTIDDLVKKAHEGQVRRGNGEPYFNHVKRVADNARTYCIDMFSHSDCNRIYRAALMHDIVEDCELTAEIVEQLQPVSEIVYRLTRKKGQSKALYYLELMQSSPAIIIKCFDRLDNLDKSAFSEEGWKRYVEETETFIIPLAPWDLKEKLRNKINKEL